MARKFEVVVGNVDVVWRGSSHKMGAAEFNEWVENSQRGIGRAAGESVTLLENGEPIREYEPEE